MDHKRDLPLEDVAIVDEADRDARQVLSSVDLLELSLQQGPRRTRLRTRRGRFSFIVIHFPVPSIPHVETRAFAVGTTGTQGTRGVDG